MKMKIGNAKKIFLIIIAFLNVPFVALYGTSGLEKAHAAFEKKFYESAIILYNKCLKQVKPNSEEEIRTFIELSNAYYLLGIKYFEKKEYELASKLFYSANSPVADSMEAKSICKIAENCFKKGELDTSLQLFESVNIRIKEADEGIVNVFNAMAEREFNKKHYSKSCSLYCMAGSEESTKGATKCLTILARQKAYVLSANDINSCIFDLGLKNVLSMGFHEFLKKVGKETEATNLLNAGNANYEKGNYIQADAEYTKIEEKYEDTKAYTRLDEEKISTARKKANRAKNRIALYSRRNLKLSTFLWHKGFSSGEIVIIGLAVKNMSTNNGLIILTQGISITSDMFEASAEWRNMTSYQRLYGAIFTAEMIASSSTSEENWAQFLYLKETLLSQWLFLSQSLLDKIVLISSKEM